METALYISIEEDDVFGKMKHLGQNGNPELDLIRRFTLTNCNGVSLQVINYGATITSLKVPDKNGMIDDIVLGFDTFKGYANHSCYFGATIGRFANRIANGKFTLENCEYSLKPNEGGFNHLHGGIKGFDKVLWESHVEGSRITFSYLSLAKEEEYPGNVSVTVSYELTTDDELIINYQASNATEKTPINMTNHSYFNLGGHDSGSIENHEAVIYADFYLPVNEKSIPTGEIAKVDGTVFDIRKAIGLKNLSQVPGGGYDHNFCLDSNINTLTPVASIFEPTSGRRLNVSSNQPGVQFYTANFLPTDDSLKGKNGAIYKRHGAFCLETQNYPDAVNQANFPSCLIGPGENYSHKTIFKFISH